MSGSLQVLGTTGTWSAQAANSALGIGQSTMAAQLWIEINSISGTNAGDIFFLSNTSGFIFQINPGTNNLTASLAGISTSFNYTKPIVLGKTIHFVMVFNSVGTSTIYVNGVSVATGTNLGVTSSTPAGPKLAWLATGGGANFTISDPAVWQGNAPTTADIIALRNRTATPATTSVAAASWWTVSGTAATNPVASAAGMLDQIGTNHFATIGGTSTNAVYSATNLVYFSPLAVERVYVSKNQLVTFFIGTNPNNGTVVPSPPTAINTDPTISINGTPTTPSALSPIWSPGGSSPCIEYHFTQTIAPTDIVTWSTVDSWTSNATGTAGIESGTAQNYVGQLEPGAFTYLPFALPDSQKKLKIGFNGNAGETGESGLGKNAIHRVGAPLHATSTQNNFFPLTVDSTGSVTFSLWSAGDANGIDNNQFPTPVGPWTLIADETNPGAPMVVTLLCFNGAGTVSGGTPSGTGTNKRWDWTVTHTPGQIWNVVLQLVITTPGGGAGNQTLRNFRMFEPGNAATLSPGFLCSDNYVRMLNPAPGVYSPVVRFMEALTGSDGAASLVAPADLRPSTDFSYHTPNYTNQSYNGTAADWPTASPTTILSREIPIYQTRPYSVTPGPGVSGKIYLSQHFKRSVASTDFAAYPYEWVPLNNGLDYDWYQPLPFLNTTSVTTAIVEFVCGDSSGNPINHNLQTGQIVGLGGFTPVTVSNANGTGSAPFTQTGTVGGTGTVSAVWVTSPTTFIIPLATNGLPAGPRLAQATTTVVQSGNTTRSGVAQAGSLTTITLDSGASSTNNIYTGQIVSITSGTGAGQQTQISSYAGSSKVAVFNIPFTTAPDSTSHFSIFTLAQASIYVPGGDFGYTVEAIGGVPATLPGTAIWIAVPHAMGEVGITAYATRLFNATPRGTKVYIEYSNEILIPNTQFLFLIGLTALEFGNGSTVSMEQAAVQRMADVHAIFTSVWGSDSGSLVRVYQTFAVSPVTTQLGLAYAQANSIPIDAIAIAPYPDIDLVSAPIRMAAAAIAWEDNDSIAAAINGGPGIQFPMAAYHDVARHWNKYRTDYNGPNGYITLHYGAIAATGYGGGGGSSGFTYPVPKIVFYETNFWTPIPSAVSLSNSLFRSALTHDFMYHPEYYNTMNGYFGFCQQPGPAGSVGADAICIENLTFHREDSGESHFMCSDGKLDSTYAAISGVYLHQLQQAGFGLSNQFAGFGGATPTLTAKDAVNQSVVGQAANDWMIAAFNNSSGGGGGSASARGAGLLML